MKPNNALNTINHYLQGNDQALVDFETYPIPKFDEVFFNTRIHCDKSPSLKLEVEALLEYLSVPQAERGKYVKSTATIFGLLKLLSKRPKEENPDAHEKLDEVIKRINNLQLIQTLRFLGTHLAIGESEAVLLNYLTSYDKKMAKVNADFYTTTINSDPAIQNAADSILTSLGVSQKRGRYIDSSLTIHEFLQELIKHTKETDDNKEKLAQLRSFVKSIETKSKISWQKALVYGLVTLFPIVASMPFGGFSVIEQIVTAALFMPVAGLAISLGIGLYSLYTTNFNKNIPLFDKIRDNFFILADTAITVTKHSLVIAAVATAAPVSAILTVAAMGVSVLHKGFTLLQMKIQGLNKPQRDGSEDLSVKQQDARFYSEYKKEKNLLWVNFVSTIALTGIVAAACFAPGGIVLIASTIAAAILTYGVKWSVERTITKTAQESLRATFDELERVDKTDNKLAPSKELTSHATLVEGLQRVPVSSMRRAGKLSSGYSTDDSSTSSTPKTPETPGEESLPLQKGYYTSGFTVFGQVGLVPDVFANDEPTPIKGISQKKQ